MGGLNAVKGWVGAITDSDLMVLGPDQLLAICERSARP